MARVCFDDGIVGKVFSGRLRLNSAVHTGELHEMVAYWAGHALFGE
ncbi:hypothetical protein [Rhodopirellula bahusiensis]